MPIVNDQTAIACVLIVALGLFAWGRLRYDLVAMLALLSAVLPGLVPAGEAFSGSGHPAVVTLAAVLGLSRALQLSGVVSAIAAWLVRLPLSILVTLVAMLLIPQVWPLH